MSGGRRLATYYAARLGAGLVTLAFVPMATRVGGAEVYGVYAAVFASALLISGVATTWMRQYLLRKSGSEVPDTASAVSIRWLQLVGAPLAAFLLGLLVAPTGTALAGAALAAAMSFYSLASGTLEATGRIGTFAFAEVLRGVLSVALLASLIRFDARADAPALVVIVGAGYWAAVALGWRTVDRDALAALGRGALRDAWRFGWPLSLWVAFTMMVQYADRAMLIRLASLADAGTYAATYDVVLRGVSFGLLPITHAVHVTFAEHWNGGDRQSAMAIRRKAIVLQIVLSIVALGLMLLVDQVVNIGEVASGVLAVPRPTSALIFLLVSGQAIWNVSLLIHKPLEFSGRTGLLATFAAAMAATNVALNWVWIPRYGTTGAATATLITATGYVLAVMSFGPLSRVAHNRSLK